MGRMLDLKQWFGNNGIDYDTVMNSVKDVIIKTLVAFEPKLTEAYSDCTPHRNICFELLSFDVLVDSSLRAHLIEINADPWIRPPND